MRSSGVPVYMIWVILRQVSTIRTSYKPEWKRVHSKMARSVRRMHMVREPLKGLFVHESHRYIASFHKEANSAPANLMDQGSSLVDLIHCCLDGSLLTTH